MPRMMLYMPCLHGYTPYARRLRSSPTEWIIWWIAHRRKLANPLFETMNEFSYHVLFIIHAYNAGISHLRSYARLWSYAWLRLEDSTLVRRRDSGRMPDSNRKMRHRSYAWLRSEDMTPIVYPNSGRTSWLWSYLPTPVTHHGFGPWVCCMSYQLICEILCMVETDECKILQLEQLVKSRSSKAHDHFSVQNLITSRLHMFKSQAMCHVTNEHLARFDLRENQVSKGTWHPCNLGGSKTSNV
jgi:hypothetical protein